MEFREFSTPEVSDYDITSSMDEGRVTMKKDNSLMIELIDLVGILEDGEWTSYGMTEEEYMNPTRATIEKVRQIVQGEAQNQKTR